MNDLDVIPSSHALAGRRLDVVVSGSIAAVESVKFIRALRRLGAEVTPWLSKGGATFITPMAVSWAAGKEAITGFSGNASHIATSDAVIVAPASSSILAKIARGMTGSHCTALISSALGQTIPVLILPSMHDSLLAAPAMREHLAKISAWKNVSMLNARTEEGKQKFPVPAQLADEVAHIMNQPLRPTEKILVTMGTTRGYIDDIRYISNYSSGTLGSLICEELYRQGFSTFVVAGPCERKPTTATTMKNVLTTSDMLAACTDAENQGLAGGIFCASVLDYEPNETTSGKIKSGKPNFSISFKPTPKIIDLIRLTGLPKIGFKLEVGLSESQTEAVAKDYIKKYNLTMLVANELASVSATTHRAIAFTKNSQITKLNSKSDIAQHISQQLAQLSAH